MHEPALTLVADLALVLCTAALVTVLFQRLRLPAVLGYLLAGTLIGPHVALTPTVSEESIRTLADLGVILLMFSLGLGFTLEKLLKVAANGGIIATVEMGFAFMGGFLVASLWGVPPLGAVFVGAIVGLTSTMFVAQTLAEARVSQEVRQRVFGVLVFEDLVTIVLLAALTALTAGQALSARELGGIVARLGTFLVLTLAGGMLVVPRAARAVVRLRRPETTTVAAAGFAFALAILADLAGLSVALGAFLAGALVAESGAGRIVEESIRPLRDVFAAVFFVATGMLVDPAIVVQHLPLILALGAVVLAGKTLGGTIGSFLTGGSIRSSVQTGLALCQIGEFSFILVSLALARGVLPESFQAVTVGVAVVLAALAPPLVRGSGRIGTVVDRRLPKPLQTWASLYGSWLEQLQQRRHPQRHGRYGREIRVILLDALVIAAVVIGTALARPSLVAGLDRMTGLGPRAAGYILTAMIFAATFPFLVGLLRNGRRLAHRLAVEALAPRPGVDLAASPRRALQRTLEVAVLLVVAAPLLAVTLPFVPAYGGLAVLAAIGLIGLAAIWRSATNLEGHVRATAEAVVEALARQRNNAAEDPLDFLRATMPGIGEPTSCRLAASSPAAGRTLKEINLRGQTGAAVVAIVRGKERIAFPGPDTRLEAGDLLALAGSRTAIEGAAGLLAGHHDTVTVGHRPEV